MNQHQGIKPLRKSCKVGIINQFNQVSSLAQAAFEVKLRENRVRHPAGQFDQAGRWYPADGEEQVCCAGIRSPSRSWRHSLMIHCRAVNHVAKLFWVTPQNLRREKRRQKLIEQQIPVPIEVRLNPISAALTATIRNSKGYDQ